MSDRFRDKYRIPSARLHSWNYGWNAAYFITICTAHRERYFGEIVSGLDNEQPAVQLSEIGTIAKRCWQQIPTHFPFVVLDEYVVMPNHVHGIIVINKQEGSCRDAIHRVSMPNDDVETINNVLPESTTISTDGVCNDNAGNFGGAMNHFGDAMNRCGDAMNRVSTDGTAKQSGGVTGDKNPMLHENISTIIRWYKGRVTYESVKIHADFAWQTRFHDHIIRNEESFQHIRSYIASNPASWEEDTLYG